MSQPTYETLSPRAPDLQTQLEDMLHAIWLAEKRWRFDDRIDLAARRWRFSGPKTGTGGLAPRRDE